MAATETLQVVWPAKFKDRVVIIDRAAFVDGVHFLPGQAPAAPAPERATASERKRGAA